MEIKTTELIMGKVESVYRDDIKYAEFIKKKWVAVDEMIEKVKELKKELIKKMKPIKKRKIAFDYLVVGDTIDKAFEGLE